MVVGDGRKYVTGIILPASDALKNWATKQGISFQRYEELLKDPKVVSMFESIVKKTNTFFGKTEKIKKGLYLVSTPIGNLGDITFRSIEVLKKSDYILCEDTRVSKILLKKYEINSKLISNHKFNEKKNVSKILNLLKSGLIISMISDAGTPSISDPGITLINECISNDIEIIPLPGPSSVITAVSISGFSEKFFFYGFFQKKKKF